jgi:hypothetical protein
VGLNPTYAKMTFERASEDPQDLMSWFFALDREAMRTALTEHSRELYNAFANAEVSDVTAALSQTWEHPDHGWDEIVNTRRPFQSDDVKEVSETLRTQAMAILEVNNLVEPFVEPDPGAYRTQNTKALSFPDITSLSGAPEVASFAADSANADVVGAAAVLGLRDDGTYDSFAMTQSKMRSALDGLKRVEELKTLAAGGSESVGVALGKEVDHLSSVTGLSAETLKEVILEGGDIDGMYETLQRGRTLVEVSRVYDVSGGGERPKARPAWGPAKRVGKAHSFPRVLSAADPVSKAVVARRAAGLPWVPRRRTR